MRDLPWRRTRDPYAIWVSEVMLQQTQVATVIPYYGRFLSAFPCPVRLAQAPLDRVLLLWSGLGYYSRARNLHAAAQRIVAEHGGRMPEDAHALRSLPGIGDYTAGAILSIAFGQRVACVDGNVERVLCRALAVSGHPKRGPTRGAIRDAATKLVDCPTPGDVNQALMELGATVCTPARPECPSCPWRAQCLALQHGVVERFPETGPRPAQVSVRAAAAVVRREGRVLIAQRGDSGVWAGLWEFPQVEVSSDHPEQGLQAFLRQQFGVGVEVGALLWEVRHGVMNRTVRLEVYDCRLLRGRLAEGEYAAVAWVSLAELGGFAFSAPHRKIATWLQGQPG
jgi:A/G-specific adenine glycosylase